MQCYIQLESYRQKILDLGWSVLPSPPYSADFTPSDFYLFHSLQNVLNEKKISLEKFVENLLENFLKPGESCLRGINKLADKWREIIQDNGEYTIDWNEFILELFMNKIYFTKTEIIYESTQYIYIK